MTKDSGRCIRSVLAIAGANSNPEYAASHLFVVAVAKSYLA